MKQDGFTKMVERRAYDDIYIPNTEAATLLRRQFSQIRRVVEAERKKLNTEAMLTLGVPFQNGVTVAFDQILTALDAYKRGTK